MKAGNVIELPTYAELISVEWRPQKDLVKIIKAAGAERPVPKNLIDYAPNMASVRIRYVGKTKELHTKSFFDWAVTKWPCLRQQLHYPVIKTRVNQKRLLAPYDYVTAETYQQAVDELAEAFNLRSKIAAGDRRNDVCGHLLRCRAPARALAFWRVLNAAAVARQKIQKLL